MNYYLIYQENELHIVPVQTGQEAAFQQQCKGCILLFGNSIGDVLRRFHELPLVFDNG
jgi:hypothetical protein